MEAPERIDPATVTIEVLRSHGYDGLYNTECACAGKELRPCGLDDDDIRAECAPGYLHPPEPGYDFMVGPEPSQFVRDFQELLAAKDAEIERLREGYVETGGTAEIDSRLTCIYCGSECSVYDLPMVHEYDCILALKEVE